MSEFIIEETATTIYVGVPRKGESKVYEIFAVLDIENFTDEGLQENRRKAVFMRDAMNAYINSPKKRGMG